MAKATVLNTFRLSDANLEADPSIKEAYWDLDDKRDAFRDAFKELKEATY
jgi:hypothetical protein